MLRRILTAAVGLPILFAALWWGGILGIVLLTLLAALLGLREFYRMFPGESPKTDRESAAESATDQNPLTRNPLQGQPNPLPGQPQPDAAAQNPLDINPLPDQPEPAAAQSATDHNPLPRNLLPGQPQPAAQSATDHNPLTRNLLKGQPLPLALGMLWVAALVLGGWVADGTRQFWTLSLLILAGGAFLALLWLLACYHGRRVAATAAWLLGGPVYVGFLLAHIPLLAQIGDTGDLAGYGYELGRSWLIFALLTTFATDSGAYFVGRLTGRHKMAPTLSPGKTWEGAAGGLAAAIIAALLLSLLPPQYLNLGLAWWQPALIGMAVGIAAQGGDLLESGLKRFAGVKDAGALFPGHGGMLDRLDSLLLTIPLVYYLTLLAFRYGG